MTDHDVLEIANKIEKEEDAFLCFTEIDDSSSGFLSSILVCLGKKSKR